MNCSLHSQTFFKKKNFFMYFDICIYVLCIMHRGLAVAQGLSTEHEDSSLGVALRLSSCGTACWILRPQPRRTLVPCIGRQILNYWTTREVPHTYSIFQHIYTQAPATCRALYQALEMQQETTRKNFCSYRVYFPVITNEQTVNKSISKYMVSVMVIREKVGEKKQDIRE